jgi:hypothetical protein
MLHVLLFNLYTVTHSFGLSISQDSSRHAMHCEMVTFI